MSKEFLSNLVHYRTYASYIPEENRRETVEETITRNMQMHIMKFPHLEKEIENVYKEVFALRAVPSMRSLQFGGEAIMRRNLRCFNCSFVNIESFKDFADLFYASMSGTGVGYSIKQRHVSKLPEIVLGYETDDWLIDDSAEGWADTIVALLENPKLKFDYSGIRPYGAKLSSGGTASGPEALKVMHEKVRTVLQIALGRQLSSFEAHRICCLIADCVVVGGTRRSALICLFDYEDKTTMMCKASATWWEVYPELARANNSCHILKSDPQIDDKIREIVQACFDGGQAEPGLALTNDLDVGGNPCFEISLSSGGTCNLTEVNAARCSSPEEFYKAVEAATAIGTLQASYTDFQYLSPKWKEAAENDALLGVSITGQAEAQDLLTPDVLRKGAMLAVGVNKIWAERLGIKPAKRITTTKPSGSASSWLGTTAGIHAGHEKRYLRRVRLDGASELGKELKRYFPNFVEQDPFAPANIVMQIPIELKPNVLLRKDETAVQCLDRVKHVYQNWIKPGHIEGANTHNISLTINYLEGEKEAIKKWMVKNKDFYYGISLIPYDGGDYQFLPYSQSMHKEIFEILQKTFNDCAKYFKFTDIKETEDKTNKRGELACSANGCILE